MALYDDPPTHPEALVLDEARLAAAIVRLALIDAARGSPALAKDARRFLGDQDGDLSWWCQIAQLDPSVVKRLVQRVLAEGRAQQGREIGEPRLLSPPSRRGQPSQAPQPPSGRV